MNLLVYKGFEKNVLENVQIKPLIDNNVEDKLNIFKFDDEYQEDIQLNILQKRKEDTEYWITYEEFTLAYDYLMLKANEGKIIIDIIDNNIYPGIYPIYNNINEELYEKYKEQKESERELILEKEIVVINNYYTNIVKINNKFYGIYQNYEFPYNDGIRKIIKFYDDKIEVAKSDKCDYLVKIGDENEDFIVYENDLLNNNYEKVAFKKFCDTEMSNKILASLKALLLTQNKTTLLEFTGEYVANDSIKNELRDIGKKLLDNENFDFRNLDFYKSPDLSNEMEEVSQSTIMEYIITEAEKAYREESYRDIFMTAPTGAGKSLIFQIPSIYLSEKYNKLILIIEPLKGLMNEQERKLKVRGYNKASFLNSDIPTAAEREEIVKGIKEGNINILYISPETLLSHNIQGLIGDREIGLIIVDEAHIVTTWGVGFRPDYWYLGKFLNELRSKKNKKGQIKKYHNFPIFACTATAVNGGKDDTVIDTVLSLYMKDPIVKIGTPKRKNISFEIINHVDRSHDDFVIQKVETTENRIKNWIESKRKAIIYCPYKSIAHNMYNGYKEFHRFFKFKDDTGVYTGNYEGYIDKNEVKESFEKGEKNIIYATKAFGMGMDIPDIEIVYHYAVTGNLSDYIQEIGRAARDENIEGKAIVDYFDGDMKYMNSLFGMSQIKQFHVKKCLSIIYDTYKNHNRRNFLINPKMFNGIFGKNVDDEELERKLKIVLLMIEKDFLERSGTHVMSARPSALFTKSYVAIDENKENEILEGKYGKYLKLVDYKIEKRVVKNYLYNNGNLYISNDVGRVYEIDLKQIWEDENSSMPFNCFKYLYYNKSEKVMGEVREYIYPRVKLKIKTKQGNFNELYQKIIEETDYVSDKLATFEKNYFTKEEFKRKIIKRYHNSVKAEVIANTYLEIIDYKGQCVKYRNNENSEQTCQITDGSLRYLVKDVLKSSLMKKLSKLDTNEYNQFFAESKEDNNLLKLLSIFELITYEIEGGNTPEMYIYINTPDKIRNIVEDRTIYKNSYVTKAQERHYRSVKILDYFFRNFNNDKDKMWDFVERYFLGEDIEAEIDEINGINKEKSNRNEPITKYIDIESDKTYSLEDYQDWNMIIQNIIEDKYKYFCNVLKENNKRIPDYAYTDITINKTNISSLLIYAKENVIVLPELTNFEVIEKCKNKGWNVVLIDEIEEKLDLIGEVENG